MGTPSVTNPAPIVELPRPDDATTDLSREVSVSAPEGFAVPVAAPMAITKSAPLETSSVELELEAPMMMRAMAAAEPQPMGPSSGNVTEDSFVTFSSLDMAAAILGLTPAQKEELAALGTLKFHFTRNGNNNVWTPITTQRSGRGSILDSGANALTYVAAGDAITVTRSNTLPAEVPVHGVLTPLTIDVLRSMSSDEQRALLYSHGWIHDASAPPYDGSTDGYWNWAHQTTGLTALQIAEGPPLRVQRPADPLHAIPALTMILGEKGQPIIVDNLNNQSIPKLTAKEQLLVSGLPVFYNESGGLAKTLGLSALPSGPLPDPSYDESQGPNRPPYSIPYPPEAWRALLLNVPTLAENLDALGAHAGHLNRGSFNEPERNVFREMMNEIAKKLTTQVIYSKQALQDEASAILARYKIAWAYGSRTMPPNDFDSVTATDGGQTIRNGFNVFMEQERRLLQLARTRRELLAGSSGNKKLDLPALIVQLQLLYSLGDDARIACKSEEVRQINFLLKDYSEIQRLVSISAGFNSDASIGHLGGQVTGPSDLGSQPQRRLIGMFQSVTNYQPHPLEELRGITRPREDLYGDRSGPLGVGPVRDRFNNLSSNRWSQYGNQLAGAVTIINQESQVLMNDISALDKGKNRHTEAGTNALSRLNEILLAITRGF